MLTQGDKLIGVFSRALTKTQQNYTVSERGLLAILEALKQFRCIVFNSKITVMTDHMNLLTSKDINSNRFQRWKLLLNEYDIVLKYTKGSENTVADTLSRCYLLRIPTHKEWSIQIQKLQEKVFEDIQVKQGVLKLENPLNKENEALWTTHSQKIFIPEEAQESF